MFVVARHTISDPSGFTDAVGKAMPGIPADVKLHQFLPNTDGTAAVCLWEGASVEAVRRLVDDTTGATSRNEFYEVAPNSAVGLPGSSR